MTLTLPAKRPCPSWWIQCEEATVIFRSVELRMRSWKSWRTHLLEEVGKENIYINGRQAIDAAQQEIHAVHGYTNT